MDYMKELMDKIESWCSGHNLKCSFAERNGTISHNFYKDGKNDCRIYSRSSAKHGSVDERRHLSVWLYGDFASIAFCVEDKDVIDDIESGEGYGLEGKEYQNVKRMHYKVTGQDVEIKEPYGEHEGDYKEDILKKLDILYEVVKDWLEYVR